jgi:hypothetical protein
MERKELELKDNECRKPLGIRGNRWMRASPGMKAHALQNSTKTETGDRYVQ